MENLSVSSNKLNFVDNSTINFTGICDKNTFNISTDRTFSEEVLNDFIMLPSDKIPIKEINAVDIKNAILSYKVIETPGNTNSNFVENYEKKRVTGKKISVFGVICLDITYTGEDPAATNQSFSGRLPFTSYIVVPKTIVLTDKFDVSCCVQKINIISTNNPYINVSASITVSAKRNRDPIPVIGQPNSCSCSGSNSLVIIGTTSGLKLRNLITAQDKIWNEISFSKNLILPNNLPNAKSVTSISSSIKIISQKIIETPEVAPNATNVYGQSILGKKLIINLMLKQRIAYVADNESTSNHSLLINTPVSCYIIIPKTTNLNQRYKIDSYIETLHACAIGERILFSGTIFFLKATQENCTPINISTTCCNQNKSNYFDILYSIKENCNLRAIPTLVNRTLWGETTVSKRINASEDTPIHFIKNASSYLKIISMNTISTANSLTQISHEGFLLSGLIALIDGYLVTNITYNSKNSSNSVISKDISIPFSTFIVLLEEPTATTKLILTASCIENFSASVLDENGIGIFAQLFFNARIVPKTN